MLTKRWQKIFALNPVRRLAGYAPLENSEALSWLVLVPTLLAFSLVLSPVVLESIPVFLSVLILAGLGAVSTRVRALGLGFIGIPALLALLFYDGAVADKSWAAMLAMLEFYALKQLIWGLEEEAPQPWRTTLLLWFLMPSALGLLGIFLLMLLSHFRWLKSLSLSRVTRVQSLGWHWGFIVLGLVLLAGLSTFLPLPTRQGLSPPSLPTLLFSSPTKNAVPNDPITPDVLTAPFGRSQARDAQSTNWTGGLGWTLFLIVAYFFYVQKILRQNTPARGTAAKQSNQTWVWLLLFGLSGVVLLVILFGLNSPTQPLKIQVDSSQTGLLALLFFLGLIVLWRLKKPKLGLVKLEKPLNSDSELEKLRYLAPKDAVRAAYFQWLVALRDLEIRRSPTQTPLEFMGLVQILHPQLNTQTQTLTEAYQRVRYGATPSQDELETVLEALGAWQNQIATILPSEITPQMVGSTS